MLYCGVLWCIVL
ncbi:hypothetical protein QTP86_009034 [Hemibagrus guttatus]|nr:hypothetical protein QTP86_009034 [Hemibagrus guttatus]